MIIYKLPVPSTSLFDISNGFEIRPGSVIALCYSYETADDNCTKEEIAFEGVEAYKVTYFRAQDISMLDAYNKLINCGSTDWLSHVINNLKERDEYKEGLMHMMINFDDGPCYEILCRKFRVVQDKCKLSDLD
jgi:hypothetical protein